jgi:biotin transport system substrate-specific component
MRASKIKSLILIALFASLTAAGAFLKIPMWPASISLQFMFTAFAGVLLGGKRAAASQLVYLLIGLAGIPVFTEGGGIGYIARPSFGFLVGLIPAAYVIGALSAKRKDIFGAARACAAGLAVLYLIGLPYLYIAVNFIMGAEMKPLAAVYSGMLLFLPGDALKIAAVSVLSGQIRKRMGNITT